MRGEPLQLGQHALVRVPPALALATACLSQGKQRQQHWLPGLPTPGRGNEGSGRKAGASPWQPVWAIVVGGVPSDSLPPSSRAGAGQGLVPQGGGGGSLWG